MEKKGILKDKSFAFAVRIINFYKYFGETQKEFIMSKQMLRSGTSAGANIREAQNTESSMNFIHKLGVAQKECDETIYRLELLVATGFLTKEMFDGINNDASEKLTMIKSAIITKKKNINEL